MTENSNTVSKLGLKCVVSVLATARKLGEVIMSIEVPCVCRSSVADNDRNDVVL